MKKVILLNLIIFSFLNLNSMGFEKKEDKKNEQIETKSNKFELPEEIWALIFDQLINFKEDIIKSARTIPELKLIIKKIHKSYFPISKKHNEILKKRLNEYYIQRKNEILQEIREKFREIIPTEIEWFKDNNINAFIKWGNDMTALMFVSMFGYKELAELLIQNGADINAKDEDGLTALSYALYYYKGDKEIINLLTQNNVTINKNGFSEFNLIDINQHEDIIELLNKYIEDKKRHIEPQELDKILEEVVNDFNDN